MFSSAFTVKHRIDFPDEVHFLRDECWCHLTGSASSPSYSLYLEVPTARLTSSPLLFDNRHIHIQSNRLSALPSQELMPSKFEDDLLYSYPETELTNLCLWISSACIPSSRIFLLSAKLLTKYNVQRDLEDTIIRAVDVARQLGICVSFIKRVIKFKSFYLL